MYHDLGEPLVEMKTTPLLTLPELQEPGGVRATNTQNEDVDKSNLRTDIPNKIRFPTPPTFPFCFAACWKLKLDELSQGTRVHLVFCLMSKSWFGTATLGRSKGQEIQRDALCFPQNPVLVKAVLNTALGSQKEETNWSGDQFEKWPFEAEPGTCLQTPTLHLTQLNSPQGVVASYRSKLWSTVSEIWLSSKTYRLCCICKKSWIICIKIW